VVTTSNDTSGGKNVTKINGLIAATLLASAAAIAPASAADDITLGFVTHAQGNPSSNNIDAQAAARLGVTGRAQQPGNRPRPSCS
jgi:hypothetical protein